MKENLLFLFLSGIILGSGPCVSFCAPILMSYACIYKDSLKKATVSYLVFSLCKIISYLILGMLCGVFAGVLKSDAFLRYSETINIILGIFILIIGISVLFSKNPMAGKYCTFLHKGNIRNVGILGFLVGFSPCLPLFGILNYIVIISNSVFDAVFYAFVFGLGSSLSPLLLLVSLSGKFSDWFSRSEKSKLVLNIVCALILIFLAGRIILQTLLH